MEITSAPCMVCGLRSTLEMTEEQYREWKVNRADVQVVFSDWSDGKRELLITGTHDACWDSMFADSDE
jgi:hypothetical protein